MKKKSRLTPKGRKALSAAMKKRWAVAKNGGHGSTEFRALVKEVLREVIAERL